jgi:hypothetical protein
VWCGVGHLHKKKMAGKRQQSIDTYMLQLQVGGRTGTSFLQLSRLQECQGTDAKEKVAEDAQDYNGEGVLFQPYQSRTTLRDGATQQHTATTSVTLNAQACPATVGDMSALRYNQQQVPSQFRLLMQTVRL